MNYSYAILLLLGICFLSSCQGQEEILKGDKRSVIKIEARAPNLLIKYRSPQYSFPGMMATDYFRRTVTAQDTISMIDSLLSQIDGKVSYEKQEYIAGIIIHYETKAQDSVGFGYRGIYYHNDLYKYTANADLSKIVSSLLPPINRFTLLLGINPDDKEVEQKLREAIDQALIPDTGTRNK